MHVVRRVAQGRRVCRRIHSSKRIWKAHRFSWEVQGAWINHPDTKTFQSLYTIQETRTGGHTGEAVQIGQVAKAFKTSQAIETALEPEIQIPIVRKGDFNFWRRIRGIEVGELEDVILTRDGLDSDRDAGMGRGLAIGVLLVTGEVRVDGVERWGMQGVGVGTGGGGRELWSIVLCSWVVRRIVHSVGIVILIGGMIGVTQLLLNELLINGTRQ